jgi:type IV secretory pathway TrbL component
LLNTQGLGSPQTARTAVTILEKLTYEGAPITFDVTLHGLSRSRNMLQLAFTPPFLPAVLCLVFAGALIAIVALAGNPRVSGGRNIPFGKLTLVDNTAKLVAQAGRNAGVAERYVAMIRRQAIRSLGLSATATEAQQAAMLDALHTAGRKTDASRYSELAGNVAKASRPAAMLQAMKRMYRWKQELGRERNRR